MLIEKVKNQRDKGEIADRVSGFRIKCGMTNRVYPAMIIPSTGAQFDIAHYRQDKRK